MRRTGFVPTIGAAPFTLPAHIGPPARAGDHRARDMPSDRVHDGEFASVGLDRLADNGPMDPEGVLSPHLLPRSRLVENSGMCGRKK